jgi:hypothetical protein
MVKKEGFPKDADGKTLPLSELFAPLRDFYLSRTGIQMHENTILHHRLSLYGPPCQTCGKPLRTSQALMCVACGSARASAEEAT